MDAGSSFSDTVVFFSFLPLFFEAGCCPSLIRRYIPAWKRTWQPKSNHVWRCISFWKGWFSVAMLVCCMVLAWKQIRFWFYELAGFVQTIDREWELRWNRDRCMVKHVVGQVWIRFTDNSAGYNLRKWWCYDCTVWYYIEHPLGMVRKLLWYSDTVLLCACCKCHVPWNGS